VCGIAGIARPSASQTVDEQTLLRMAAAVRHRGPDGFGLALDAGAGVVSARLAIFDIPHGWQPLEAGPRGSILVYNGEVYNHPELRRDLVARGESFATTCDTEVVLRLLELDGISALDKLNGQFAFAWWQPDLRRLTMVRDRFGVRPLHYSLLDDGSLVFGSEAKALFASGEVAAEPDLVGIDEVFTLWGPRAPRTVFRGIKQVMAGGLAIWERGRLVTETRWWSPEYHVTESSDGNLEALLRDSVRLRLRADVPVGTYLSGGLDSSVITALAQAETGHQLRTFSIAFMDPRYDERAHQEHVARAIGTRHHVVEAGPGQIADAFPEVIRHVEMPLVRTAPVPLFLLARDVRAHEITVVATGEGADELFWGYELFKEVALRELARSEPERAAELLGQLYSYLGPAAGRRGPAWHRFLLETGADDELLGSHLTRARATAAIKAFYRGDVAAEIGTTTSLDRIRAELPPTFDRWSRLERAAWLELTTLLEPYLLSAQGDRVAMAHGVEGRFPFLDHRVFAYSTRLPAEKKLGGMREKVALRDVAARVLPPEIAERGKQPYRAPEVAPFFSAGSPDWVEEALSSSALGETELWDEQRVAALLRRCRAGRVTGMRESMALVGILSTQLWYREFVGKGGESYPPEEREPRIRINRDSETRSQRVA
jgi:asparagine synthase (glutamine-hydrolysing)